ncbi:hypothetical protein [Acinetobacter bereziniae]|uniref:hypothetical protein n=1 Tax=Acinetobacter bereziniae TaxID=106648 RepID=UPI001D189840|nr:hypothetical protein [Acinetobacter bereziniae]
MIFLTSIMLLLNSALVNASIGGWTLSNPTAVGASILYDGTKGSLTSSVLISPNASQVAKVLRGGLVGYALTFAVEQLLGAVDWVLDPANNAVKYKKIPDVLNSERKYTTSQDATYFYSGEAACRNSLGSLYVSYEEPEGFAFNGNVGWCNPGLPSKLNLVAYPNYPTILNPEKYLSLITAAQQVIENAESDNLNAQFAVLAAATNILSEAEQDDAKAKPYEDELERNADDKCKDHNFKMDSQAAIVEWRYNELIADRYNLFINNKSVSNPLILNGVNKGTWDGHVDQYKYAQGVLRNLITKASNAGCPATPRADKWVNIEPPSQPGSSL